MITIPEREIRAVFDDRTIRVYQAYSDPIADAALRHGTFVSPFKMTRMTWIKPSFLWMMYRAGYGFKDGGQNRILAIDITREGFEWALENSCGSRAPAGMEPEQWAQLKASKPVRIQWDPERDLDHNPLPHRSIQIGIRDEAVERYVNDWIVKITEITEQAHAIYALVKDRDLEAAAQLLPDERPYPARLPDWMGA